MRLIVLIFLSVLAFVGYLAYLNPGEITFFLAPGSSLRIPTTALVLLSMVFGGAMVALVAGFIETKHLFMSWRHSRLRRREGRISELLHQALNAKTSRRSEEAIDYFLKVLEIDSHHVPTLLQLGDLYRARGDSQEALRYHHKAHELDKNNIEVLLSLSSDLEDAKRIDEAIGTLNEILKIDRESLTALIRLRGFYVQLGRWEEAHEIQERVMKADPPAEELEKQQSWFIGIKYQIGMSWIEKGESDQARNYFKACIKLKKDFIPAHLGMGDAFMIEGKNDDAGKLWEAAYETTRDVILLHRLEDLYLPAGQPSRILGVYHDAIQKDPANPVLQFFLGKLYYRLEMVDDALDTLNGIDLGDQRMPDLHKLLGNLLYKKGELSESVEEFKKALNLKKRVLIPYYCPSCDFHSIHWAGRCPRCLNWNTFIASPIIRKEPSAKTMTQSRP